MFNNKELDKCKRLVVCKADMIKLELTNRKINDKK